MRLTELSLISYTERSVKSGKHITQALTQGWSTVIQVGSLIEALRYI